MREHLLHVTSAFVLVLALQLTMALKPSTYGLTAVIYGFTAVYGFIAITCNLWLLLGTCIGPN